MDKGASVDEASLPIEAPLRGSGWGSSFTGDSGRYVEKVSGYGHLSPWGHPFCRGETGVGGARIPGTLTDERRRAPLLGNQKDEFF